MFRYLNSALRPLKTASYYEFASHILIPLSIVKQRSISPAPAPPGDRQILLDRCATSTSVAASNHTNRVPTSQGVGTPAAARPTPPTPRSVPARVALFRLESVSAASAEKLPGEPIIIRPRAWSHKGGPNIPSPPPPHKNGEPIVPAPRSSAPSRNRTENLLIKSQLL